MKLVPRTRRPHVPASPADNTNVNETINIVIPDRLCDRTAPSPFAPSPMCRVPPSAFLRLEPLSYLLSQVVVKLANPDVLRYVTHHVMHARVERQTLSIPSHSSVPRRHATDARRSHTSPCGTQVQQPRS
eukprot:220010-Prymnesium_polylepis.1